MSHEYSVVVDVPQTAKFGTFCPFDKDRIAFCSRDSRHLKAGLPLGWYANELTAAALFLDHRESVMVTVAYKTRAIDVTANRPVIVYRRAQKAAVDLS